MAGELIFVVFDDLTQYLFQQVAMLLGSVYKIGEDHAFFGYGFIDGLYLRRRRSGVICPPWLSPASGSSR